MTNEGDAAVDALIDAYEHDHRLTRTLDYSRPWQIDRTPVPVSVAAKSILNHILLPGLVDRTTPAELRAWWAKHRSENPLLRSY